MQTQLRFNVQQKNSLFLYFKRGTAVILNGHISKLSLRLRKHVMLKCKIIYYDDNFLNLDFTNAQLSNLFARMSETRWKATIFVGGLAPMVNAASLQAAFLPFGEIVDVSLP